MIQGQTIDGCWTIQSKPQLAACLVIQDQLIIADAIQALQAKISDVSPDSSVYLTLLVLYILEEGYAEEEDQWSLVSEKAKAYLLRCGIENPYTYIDFFSNVKVRDD